MSSLDFRSLDRIAGAAERNVTLRVDRSAERALRSGHPWLFADGIREQSHEGRAGDFAVVFDRRRNFLALGLYDPASPIRVRVLHSGKPTPVDAAFFARRVNDAAALRAQLFGRDEGTTAYRVVNGENEGMPGLIADRYAETLVVKIYSPAWLPHLRDVLEPLSHTSEVERVVLRCSRNTARAAEKMGLADGAVLAGPEFDGPVLFRENGLRFECDPRRGQKTGFFLDQRDNRARLETLLRGSGGGERRIEDVLNAFSYTGGFSLYAARGGARRVVSLDASEPALQAAQRNFALNRSVPEVAGAQHEILLADAFRGIGELATVRRDFDCVVIDPPSFANRQSDAGRALAAYTSLTRLALGVVRPGGTLVFASCSARVAADDFFACVHRSARKYGRPLREIERTGHAADHPIGFPQGAYLKCLFAAAP